MVQKSLPEPQLNVFVPTTMMSMRLRGVGGFVKIVLLRLQIDDVELAF